MSRLESAQFTADRLAEGVAKLIKFLPHGDLRPFRLSIPNVPARLFEDCKARLVAHPNCEVADYFHEKMFYEYDAGQKQLIITEESNEHEEIKIILGFIKDLIGQSEFIPSGWMEVLEWGSKMITLKHNGIVGNFKADGALTFSSRRSRRIPVVVLEVAHCQTEESLLEAGTRWVKGSGGRIRTAILLKLNYPGPLTEIKLWVFRLRVDSETSWIDRWGPEVIWKPSDDPLPKPDLSLELGIEDIFGEYIETLPLNDPHRSCTFSIPLKDLRSWCTISLGLGPLRWGPSKVQRI